MKNFRGLIGNDAILEFALDVLHTMPSHNQAKIVELFKEARESEIIPESNLDKLEAQALEILPIAEFIYPSDKESEMKKFQDFRDHILGLVV